MRFIVFLLALLSFSSHAYYTNSGDDTVYLSLEAAGRGYVASLPNCVLSGSYYRTYTFGSTVSGGFIYKENRWTDSECTRFNKQYSNTIYPTYVAECPAGQEPNFDTEQCESPQPEDWCEGSEFADISAQEYLNCANSNTDNFFNFTPSCTDKNNYSFSCTPGPSKPDPNHPEDPTQPLPDVDGDFNGGSAGTSTPDAPSFDKTEPDTVTPNPETDTALLSAIQNLNRDNNQALTGLNTDLNRGLTNIDNQLSQLNQTNNAIGQSIVDQINHDRAIYEANKALALQQTGAINKAGADITGALNSGFGELGDKLGGLAAGSGTSASDTGCEAGAFSCSGNAYECYMARQAFENKCSSLTFGATDPTGLKGELQPLADSLTSNMSDFNESVSVDSLKGETLDVTSTMTTIDETNGVSFDEGCPAPKNYDYGLGSFTIDYQPFCDLAIVIRALLMLAASIGSLMLYAKFL